MSTTSIQPEAHLHRFGLESFRAGQRDVISAVLDGHDCLCIMPTGGGKSLCYQLPSVARAGTTLVVSPLIALMKDQVDSLNSIGISAAFINSSLSSGEQSERLLRFTNGEYDLLYVAPERFRSPRFQEAVRATQVQLLAVDEAHCISEWGHDFRHDYSRLGEFRQQLGNPQTIALTATATTDVRHDVVKQLGLNDPQTFVAGFARENLFYSVAAHRGKQAKHHALLDFLERTAGCGIIYCSTRASCEEVRDLIHGELRRSVVAYHGGLMADDRRTLQDTFMSGEAEIVVATNAFGMGIDKPDVRFVVHYNMPGSLEAYYQEAGRAGRDGVASRCILLYSQSDRFIQEFFIDSAHPPKESIKKVYEYLCRHPADPIELTQQELKEQIGLSIGADGVGTCERLLEKAGVLERLDSNRNLASVRVDTDAPNLAELLAPQAKAQRRVARAVGHVIGEQRYERVYIQLRDVSTLSGDDPTAVSRHLREMARHDWFDFVPPFRGRAVHMIRRDVPFDQLNVDYTRLEQRRQSNLAKLDRVVRFATTRYCRQCDILEYFGEPTPKPCGHCDNCGVAEPLDGNSGTQSRDMTRMAIPREVTAAMVQVTRMVLSGVARGQGRFGKQLIVGMLCGSQSVKIRKWKLDQLSTFGLLDRLKQNEVMEIIDALISLSLIKMVEVDKFRPTIHNSDLGRDVMMGRAELPEPLHLEPALLAKIERHFRKAAGDPPISATSPPESLEPETATEGGLLDPPQGDDTSVAFTITGSSGRTNSEPSAVSRPNFYWSWRLLNDDYTVEECLAIRNCELHELFEHLSSAHASGLPINLTWLFTDELLQWLETHARDSSDVRPLVEDWPAGLTIPQMELFAKCRAKKSSWEASGA